MNMEWQVNKMQPPHPRSNGCRLDSRAPGPPANLPRQSPLQPHLDSLLPTAIGQHLTGHHFHQGPQRWATMVRPTVSRLSLLARPPPHPLLVLHPEVQAALASRASASSRPATPLVALESTIITHGMPYPTNLSTARRVEDQVRLQGAVPATIALLDGKIHVGCDEAQLKRLAESAQVKGQAFKTGRRDLAGVLARRIIGGTTVSGTALVAHMAGINIFATGGVGGVHRGAEQCE